MSLFNSDSPDDSAPTVDADILAAIELLEAYFDLQTQTDGEERRRPHAFLSLPNPTIVISPHSDSFGLAIGRAMTLLLELNRVRKVHARLRAFALAIPAIESSPTAVQSPTKAAVEWLEKMFLADHDPVRGSALGARLTQTNQTHGEIVTLEDAENERKA